MWLRSSLRLAFTAIIVVAILSVVVLIFEVGQKQEKTVSYSHSTDSLLQLLDEQLSENRQPTPNHASLHEPEAKILKFESDENDWKDFIFTSAPTSSPPPPQEPQDLPTPTWPDRNPPEQATSSSDAPDRRRSLLIFGADRSGTTFISRMFSEDPQMFMVYEPLWVTKFWRNDKKEGNWSRSEVEVLNGILSCNFADFPMATQFLNHTSKNWAAAPFKNPFRSPNFCNVTDTGETKCPDLTNMPKLAAHVCSTKSKHSVTKVAQVRVPDKLLSSLIPQVFLENPDTDIRVLQILRDPRGSLDSRIKLGWMPKHTSPSFVNSVKYPCDKTADNVKYGRNLPDRFKKKYMEVYYRDIALSPVKTAQKIYSFAGFEMSEDLIKWIVFNTSPSEESLKQEKGHTFSSVRNSSANVEKWRTTSPKEQVEIINRECSELMQLLGVQAR